jgi:hypothetical protein
MLEIQSSSDNEIISISNHLVKRATQRIEEIHGRTIIAKVNNNQDDLKKKPNVEKSTNTKK